jgi:hypothetical protein
MFHPPFARALVASALLAAATGAAAQNGPPIKPGLWEIKVQSEADGKTMPDMSDRLKNLPPEQRAMIEAKMKERGMSLGGGGVTIKQCLNAESLSQGRWLNSGSAEHRESDRCKSDITDRSGGTWKWHMVCTQPESVSDGEADFSNPEGYTLKITNTSNDQGVPRVRHATLNANWLSASCGDLKP